MAPFTQLTVTVGGFVVVALHSRKTEVYGLLELLRQVQDEDSLEFVIDELLRRGQRRLLVGQCSISAEPRRTVVDATLHCLERRMNPLFLVVFADWIFLSPFLRAFLLVGFLERADGRVISNVLM